MRLKSRRLMSMLRLSAGRSLLASKRCSTATVEASTTSPRSGHARPLPSKFPMARPVWTPTDAQRRQAETMAAYGIPEADIARVLGVSKPTLRKHCSTELDTGATRANSKVAEPVEPGVPGAQTSPFNPKVAFLLDDKVGGGLHALNVETGEEIWQTPQPGCSDVPVCSPAQSAAVSAIPGIVFSGGI